MRGPRTRLLAAASALVVAAIGRVGFAQTPTAGQPLAVSYSAPGNCPKEADFEARVRARTAVARFEDEPSAWSVDVRVRPTGVTYAGHLSIVGRGGSMSDRDVEDVQCTDVVDALALITALSVDPNALLSSALPPAPSSIAGPEPIPSGVSMFAPPSTPRHSVEARADVDRGSEHAVEPWGANFGAAFATLSGLAPDPLAGAGLFGELEKKNGRVFTPSMRLSFSVESNGTFEARSASFVLIAGRADVCPVRFGSSDASLRVCLGADAGAVRAQGIEVPHPGAGTDFWLDALALLRARWVPSHGAFFVEGEAGAAGVITRPQFMYVVPEGPGRSTGLQLVGQPYPVEAVASLALGWRFR